MTTTTSTKDEPQETALDPTLVKKLVMKEFDGRRMISKEASLAAGELLRLFILEARNRASIEAECDTECETSNDGKVLIRPDHIAKIAAELLMDFS
ncbi:expressed unknown protein [Seminavis robusta]|uniref:Centromere protein X n=1 Tax=Seminavis robusta TaxID=568900 RepID=A0A9N8EJW9_9STRA|nr:expressed unknown protein [Seminavis robusta]|eukprot:Sro1267_g257640.1 n/a (96) ;mRNA; r:7198-7485